QGGTASGTDYINWGWVLTPQPNTIPTDGSTIKVWVDGVNVGHPVYNLYRADIATLFPGYNNSGGAVGYFTLDTTTYANGVHTIQWTATDDDGNSDGIGSRYFNIQNSGGDMPNQELSSSVRGQGLEVSGDLSEVAADTASPIYYTTGFNHKKPGMMAYPGKDGSIILKILQNQRLEISLVEEGCTPHPSPLAADQVYVYQVVNNHFRKPPTGLSIDYKTGTINWMPGPA
ncbi:MAG: hypothetical protein GY869_03945, partial [Planctomycetes bacterium]|nr:hypothetical protein [Planctomycetota bacterium]